MTPQQDSAELSCSVLIPCARNHRTTLPLALTLRDSSAETPQTLVMLLHDFKKVPCRHFMKGTEKQITRGQLQLGQGATCWKKAA